MALCNTFKYLTTTQCVFEVSLFNEAKKKEEEKKIMLCK